MQNVSYFQKIVSGESFEELEAILEGRIMELKEAYKIKDYDYAKNLRTDIEGWIGKAKKAVKIPSHGVRLAKEEKKYSILINLGKIFGGRENGHILNRLLEKIQYDNTCEKEIFRLHEEKISDSYPITEASRKSADIKLKHKPYQDHFSDYNKFGAVLDNAVKKLEGPFIRKYLCDQLKLLRKDFYRKRVLDEEGIMGLRSTIEKAKKHNMGFEDIEFSLDLLLKDALKDEKQNKNMGQRN